jgi:hypothetical protein
LQVTRHEGDGSDIGPGTRGDADLCLRKRWRVVAD